MAVKGGKEKREARIEHDQFLHMVTAPGAMVKDSSASSSKVKVKVKREFDDNRMEE